MLQNVKRIIRSDSNILPKAEYVYKYLYMYINNKHKKIKQKSEVIKILKIMYAYL